MAKPASHKLSELGSVITTSLSTAELPAVITDAAADARGNLNSPGKAHIETVTPGRVNLAVRDAFKREQLTFSVAVTDNGDGTTQLRTAIDGFKTTQSTFLFIPIAPKVLLGKRAYINFLDALDKHIAQRDPQATTQQRFGQV